MATAYRIIAKLVSWGALERTEGNRYIIGLRLWEVASLAPRQSTLRNAAMPHMMQLQSATNFSVFLAARDQCEGIWLEGVWGERSSCPGWWSVGSRFPLNASASGWVLLAYSEPALQERIYAGSMPALTEHTVTDPGALRSLVDGVKWRGHAVTEREKCDGISAIAAPVRDGRGRVVCVILCGILCGPAPEGGLARSARPVLATAQRISRQLAELQRYDEEDHLPGPQHAWE